MNRIQMLTGAALLTVLTAGGAAVAIAQSTSPDASEGKCQVTVDRSQVAGSFRVDKQRLENGDCVCYIYTGPETQGSDVEARIAEVQARRDCGTPPVAVGEAGSNVPLLVAGGIGVAGGAVALANGGGSHNDSPGG